MGSPPVSSETGCCFYCLFPFVLLLLCRFLSSSSKSKTIVFYNDLCYKFWQKKALRTNEAPYRGDSLWRMSGLSIATGEFRTKCYISFPIPSFLSSEPSCKRMRTASKHSSGKQGLVFTLKGNTLTLSGIAELSRRYVAEEPTSSDSKTSEEGEGTRGESRQRIRGLLQKETTSVSASSRPWTSYFLLTSRSK